MALKAEIEAALMGQPATTWEALFNAAGVPAGVILSVPDALRQGHLAGRAFVETVADAPEGQALRVTRPGFVLDEPFPAPQAPPALGADTATILAGAGYTAGEIAAMAARGVIRLAGEQQP